MALRDYEPEVLNDRQYQFSVDFAIRVKGLRKKFGALLKPRAEEKLNRGKKRNEKN